MSVCEGRYINCILEELRILPFSFGIGWASRARNSLLFSFLPITDFHSLARQKFKVTKYRLFINLYCQIFFCSSKKKKRLFVFKCTTTEYKLMSLCLKVNELTFFHEIVYGLAPTMIISWIS